MNEAKQEDYQYTNIDLVKVAYMRMVIARRIATALSEVVNGKTGVGSRGGHLPQKVYKTRKSHLSDAWLAAKNNKLRKPKYIKMFDKLMAAQQEYMKSQSEFELLAKNLTPEEQQSIMYGTAYPSNVLADK